MSTERVTRDNNPYSLTTFYGGKERGRCIQVTQEDTPSWFLEMTEDEAKALAFDLLAFVMDELPEKEDD